MRTFSLEPIQLTLIFGIITALQVRRDEYSEMADHSSFLSSLYILCLGLCCAQFLEWDKGGPPGCWPKLWKQSRPIFIHSFWHTGCYVRNLMCLTAESNRLTHDSRYAAVERDIPAIAFSAANSGLRSYKEINQTTPSGSPDPATIAAQLSVDLVDQLAKNTKGREIILPFGYGIE